jgi:hypothetical protein
VLLRERLNNWSLLLADVSNWATRRGIPNGSGQGNRVTTTTPFFEACSVVKLKNPVVISFSVKGTGNVPPQIAGNFCG